MNKVGKFVFLGAPGVGKGTFAKIIINRSSGKWKHLSPGDFIRKEIKAGTSIGQELHSYVKEGKLVPETLMTKYWLPTVENTMADLQNQSSGEEMSGIILDGYPRTLAQCQFLDQNISSGMDFIAINITLNLDIAVQKLLARCHCQVCGKSYNTAHIVDNGYDMPAIPPDQICSKSNDRSSCSHHLSRRSDDSIDVISQRLIEYEQNLQPVLQHYAKTNRLAEMEVKKGVKDIDKLWSIMMEKFKSRK
jgi:adenylate kinase